MYSGYYDEVAGHEDGTISPTRGLNTQSPLAGLAQNFAIKLDNWVCQPDAIVTRSGAADHATGFATNPKTLMVYSSGTQSQMFAANSSGIFNVSTPGAIGAAVIALTNGQGDSVNFATSAGQFLLFANGVDTAKLYDGTTWSASAITGPATSTLFNAETYRSRLFLLQNNFLGFYYLPADSVAGAATAFRIGAVCRLGGFAVGQGTWTIDGGTGPDDYYVVATSNGELVIYKGSDPAVVANWVFIGTYFLGKPVGTNCFAKLGGDLLYFSENGVIPLSTILQSTNKNYVAALTYNIQPSISTAAVRARGAPGWKIHVIPRLSLVLLNVPPQAGNLKATQFVFNSYSKGWSTFSEWDAADFIDFNNDTYSSTGLKIVKCFTGTADFGANIVAICDTAYNRFKTRRQLKPILVRALFASTNLVPYTIGIAQDFSGLYQENTYGVSPVSAGLWNSGLWNVAIWGGEFTLRKDWVTVAAAGGLALSTRFKVSSNIASTLLLTIDYKFAPQGLVS